VRLIVEFGDRTLEGETTVAAFVLASIEEVIEEFDNHTDPRIPDLAITLTHTPHEYSSNWEDRLQNPMQTQQMPDENYIRDAKEGVTRFKFKKVCRLCEKNQERMKIAQAEKRTDELLHLMKVHQKLVGLREELGVELGTVGVIR